jgi:4-hydroxy-2-oxoheptanedioate aldolase
MTNLFEFKQKLINKQSLIGPFMKTGDPAFVEIAGYAGFDFVILDMEHGPASIESMQNLIRGAQAAGVVPIVRTPDDTEISIARALDIGAAGVQVPQVSTAAQAKRVVAAAKYAPDGSRGVCRFVRAAHYSSCDRFEYFKGANENLVIIHLEGKEAIDNLDELLEVDGLDILFIGPYDLSSSLGVLGQVDHPKVRECMKEIIRKAAAKGKAVGTFVDNNENARLWRETGVQYISYSVDVGIFYEACRSIVQQFMLK